MGLSPKQRLNLRQMFGGRCAYCGIELPKKGWHADHVEPVIRQIAWKRSTDETTGRYVSTGVLYRPENQRPDNYFPACAPCNIDKGACGLEAWRDYLSYRMTEGLRKNSSTFRHAERFGRVKVEAQPVIFWFEKYQAIAPPLSAMG